MKVYVVKRNDGKYVKKTIQPHYYGEDYFYYEDIDYVDDLNEATIYSSIDLELITNQCKYQYKNCQVIECYLMGTNELSDYTKQVRKEVIEQVYKVFTTEDVWKELKDWYLVNGNCKELKKCLDAMVEEKSVENIAKKFGHYKNFYQQLDLLQGEDK